MAGRLHTARSRNDIDMTLYRMRQRQYLLSIYRASLGLREALLTLADRHRETVVALHTHTQPAQPSTVAHYLLAMIEQLERDAVRLRRPRSRRRTATRSGPAPSPARGSPSTGRLTSRLLGFDGPTGNTYGSIATADFLLENVTSTAVLLAGLGRFVQDMLLWSTVEFGYLRLGDGFVQGSSIMPQKRNPVALEHARAIGSKALGQATGIVLAVHNTPFGDIVDTEDDLQPLVDQMFHDAARALTLVGAALGGASFNTDLLQRRAGESWVTITELADTLVRDHGLRVRHGSRHRAPCRRGEDGRPSGADRGRRGSGLARPHWRGDHLHGRAVDGPVEPAALRRGTHDPRRAGAGGDDGRHRGFAVGPGGRPGVVGRDGRSPRFCGGRTA